MSASPSVSEVVAFHSAALDLMRLAVFAGVVFGGFALLSLAWLAVAQMRGR